jgi:hypothetical protein
LTGTVKTGLNHRLKPGAVLTAQPWLARCKRSRYVLVKNDALAHFAETFWMRRMAQRMITASSHSSAECAYGAAS